VIGHVNARAYLERELPVATLLHGPASVGKWTLANHIAQHYQVRPNDRWDVPQGLTMETVKLVSAYAARAPMGAFKLIVARLDSSHDRALHALLKTLEEPPPQVKFLLTSASRTLPTISSRCKVFELGMLNADELENIYRAQGLPQVKARRAAKYARGQVSRGYLVDAVAAPRTTVTTLISALATGDGEKFDALFKNWDGACTELLSTFFTECLTRRWVLFTPEEAYGIDNDRPRLWQMVSSISRLSYARPRLGVRAALEPFLNRR
jgi:replication-associated recombination protein RarA